MISNFAINVPSSASWRGRHCMLSVNGWTWRVEWSQGSHWLHLHLSKPVRQRFGSIWSVKICGSVSSTSLACMHTYLDPVSCNAPQSSKCNTKEFATSNHFAGIILRDRESLLKKVPSSNLMIFTAGQWWTGAVCVVPQGNLSGESPVKADLRAGVASVDWLRSSGNQGKDLSHRGPLSPASRTVELVLKPWVSAPTIGPTNYKVACSRPGRWHHMAWHCKIHTRIAMGIKPKLL